MLFATASEMLVRRRTRATLFVTFLVSLFSLAIGQSQITRIARLSLVEGEVSYQRAGDSGKDWSDATSNLPINERDQLYSGPTGRAEVQLSGRNLARIDSNTNLRFTQFNSGTTQFAIPVGTATFRVDSLDRRQFNIVDANDAGKDDPVYFEVDTPIVAATFLKEGNYRVNVRDDGSTEIIVRRGQAEVYNRQIGTVTVKQGQRIVVDGHDANYFQIARLEDKDNWDRWNDRRDDELFARIASSNSVRYVPAGVPGVYDLDNYGDWMDTPDYGYVWYPRATPVGWAPYRAGYWNYYSGWGWTWVSYEPWGWVPYHYGRWAWYGSRWCWVPRANLGLGVNLGWNWSPHLVAFFGWGGGSYDRGYRDGYRDGRYGYYGWCPLGPRDSYYGYGSSRGNNYPRTAGRAESLSNYNAPGGVSLMESRRFDNGRVVVNQDQSRLSAPLRGIAPGDSTGPMIVRNEEFKPTQAAPTRELKIERAELARRIEAPVVERRPAPGTDHLNSPIRGAASEGTGTPARAGQAPDRAVPSHNGDNSSQRIHVQDGYIIRPDKPARSTDYQTIERIPAPVRRSSEEERSAPSRPSESPRSMPTPSRSADTPSRGAAPSRSESPSRTEAPRRYDPPPVRESSPRETRRPDPPPVRDSSPARSERPAAPPARESAPVRSERPSSPPPARESAPSRQESRSDRPTAPARKP